MKPVTAPLSHIEASWSSVLNKNCLFFLACLHPPRLTVPCLLQGPRVCHQSRRIIRADNPAAGRNVCPQSWAGNVAPLAVFSVALFATFNIWIQRGSFHHFTCRCLISAPSDVTRFTPAVKHLQRLHLCRSLEAHSLTSCTDARAKTQNPLAAYQRCVSLSERIFHLSRVP